MKIDPLRAARVLRRLMLPLALLMFLAFVAAFGTVTIPAGMDTTPSAPPGSLCVIAKRFWRIRVGSLVFVEVGGGTLLTRIAALDGERIRVEHDAPDSRFPDGDELGPLPRDAIRGLVLAVFGGTGGGDGR